MCFSFPDVISRKCDRQLSSDFGLRSEYLLIVSKFPFIALQCYLHFHYSGDVSANVERKIARVHSRSSSIEYQKEGLMRKAIRGSRVSANKDEIANDVGYYQKRKETKKGELVGKALIDLAGTDH